MSLLNEIADFGHLLTALRLTARGKRGTYGFQKIFVNQAERILEIKKALLSQTYTWGKYRQFYVADPKKRLVSSASFQDRMVHTAIHQAIEPYFEKKMSQSVFACRKNKGNQKAVRELLSVLKELGPQRFVVKLDIKGYFASVHQQILWQLVQQVLPDRSIDSLMRNLISSYHSGHRNGGIPIGNLTSQLFANFFLLSADAIAHRNLDGFFIRYMDDFVLVGRNKANTFSTAKKMVAHLENDLQLEVPYFKQTVLGSDPIPFLGFVVSHEGCRVLRRNERRFGRKLKALKKRSASLSYQEQVKLSYEAWRCLGSKQECGHLIQSC